MLTGQVAPACALLLICCSAGAPGSEQTVRTPGGGASFTLIAEARDSATGRTVPARFYLTDSAGRHWTPGGAIAYEKGQEKHFIAPGRFQMQLPPGEYTLVVERGPEYRPWTGSVIARAGESSTVTAPLARWIDMNRRG